MLRPTELNDDGRVQAWLILIEQEILLAEPAAEIVRIRRHIPPELIDVVDNRLRMEGWRLHRPVDPRRGQTQPNRTQVDSMGLSRPTDGPFFEVVADVSCDPHDWHPSISWAPPGTPRTCLFCGEQGTW